MLAALEFILEAFYFIAEDIDSTGGVLINNSSILDLLRPCCELQSRQSLPKVQLTRADIRHNAGLRVASQRVLQQERELRISVVHMPGLTLCDVNQGIDYVSKC